LAAAVLAVPAASARAQAPSVPAPEAAPDSATVARLIWSTMAAVDQANQTGNYSVLRDLGAPSFQGNYSAARLGGIFEALRAQRIDVGATLVVIPTYQAGIVQNGLLRILGSFPVRPARIGFDLLFQNVNGQWRLFGIAVAPLAPVTTGR
jgi:hypothetical protein